MNFTGMRRASQRFFNNHSVLNCSGSYLFCCDSKVILVMKNYVRIVSRHWHVYLKSPYHSMKLRKCLCKWKMSFTIAAETCLGAIAYLRCNICRQLYSIISSLSRTTLNGSTEYRNWLSRYLSESEKAYFFLEKCRLIT
jgi:hypothetical protein